MSASSPIETTSASNTPPSKTAHSTAAEARALVRLALPLIAVNVGNQLMGVVDTALSGRAGALAQAATGLGSTIFFLGALFGIGLTMGADPLTAQAFGAGRPDTARKVMWQCVWVAALATLPLGFLILGAGFSLETIGIGGDLGEETRVYMHARLYSLLPMMLVTAMRSYCQAAQTTGPIVASTVVGNVVNLILSWALMFGDAELVRLGLPALGIPEMGVAGLGWATSVSTALSAALLALSLRRPESERRNTAHRRFDRDLFVSVTKLGAPIGLHMMAEMGLFTLVGVFAGTMGTVEMAAHQVALQLAGLTFMVPMGLGAATSVRVGNAIGRGDPGMVRTAGLLGIVIGVGFMTLSALSMWSLTDWYAALMTQDPRVMPLAAQLILIAAAFQIFDGTQVVAAGALRGLGLTRWTMGTNLFSYWGVGLPAALWFGFSMQYGPHGLWWGLTLGLAVAATLLTARFLRASRPKSLRGIGLLDEHASP